MELFPWLRWSLMRSVQQRLLPTVEPLSKMSRDALVCFTSEGIVIIIVVLAASIFLGKRRKCASSRTVTDLILARLKIVIGFYQVTSGTLNTFSYVEWPSALLTVVYYANMVQLNLLEIFPLQCFADNLTINVYTRLSFVVGSNTTIVFLAAFIYQIRKLSSSTVKSWPMLN